jgi:hypothetical protein
VVPAHHRQGQHVRDDLPPQRGAAAAAGQVHPLRPDAEVAQHVDVMPERERHALEHGAEQVPAPVSQVQPDQGPPRQRVVDRGLLTEEVRGQDQAAGARPGAGGLRVQQLK